jgi:adenylyltransferase/sulfurtransferase
VVLDLTALARALEGRVDEVLCNGFLLAFRIERYELTVFPDGRALVRGSTDPGEARAVYARYIGN